MDSQHIFPGYFSSLWSLLWTPLQSAGRPFPLQPWPMLPAHLIHKVCISLCRTPMVISNCPQALENTALQSLLLWQQRTRAFVLAHVSVTSSNRPADTSRCPLLFGPREGDGILRQGMSEELVKPWKDDTKWLWQGKLFQVKRLSCGHDNIHHKTAINLFHSNTKLYLQKASSLPKASWFSVGIANNTFVRQRPTQLTA